MVAIHEAGHVVVGRHVGARVDAHIFRRCDATIEGDTSWGGQARWFELDRKLSRARRLMIGIAGAIAEHVWRDDADFLRSEGEWAWDEETIMSPTDWAMAGCAPGEPTPLFMQAVRLVIDLLTGELRAELYATARRLIVDYGHAEPDQQVAACAPTGGLLCGSEVACVATT